MQIPDLRLKFYNPDIRAKNLILTIFGRNLQTQNSQKVRPHGRQFSLRKKITVLGVKTITFHFYAQPTQKSHWAIIPKR